MAPIHEPGPADPVSLGAFLRARRERVGPAEVGLPAAGRRRTPGLRREELALLAGISVDYLVRLEQGRDRSPSASVLAALADVLGLSDDERRHLKTLVVRGTDADLCPSSPPGPEPLSEATREVLDRLDPMPAFVLSEVGELLAWNATYGRLMAPTGLLDLEPPNILRFTFLVPASRAVFRDWEAIAGEQVANLRAASTRCSASELELLVGELSVRSDDFARLWARHEVGEKRAGVKALAHPVVGDLDVMFEALTLPGLRERRLVTYRPADAVSASRLDLLVEDPARSGPTGRPQLRSLPGTGSAAAS